MESADCSAFMGGLSYRTSCLDIESFFTQHDCKVRKFKLLKGYAFVQFYNQYEADRAIELLNGRILMGKVVRLEHPHKDVRKYYNHSLTNSYGDEPTQFTYNLNVDNLSPSVSWQDLKNFMKQAGHVVYTNTHKYREGEGIVKFSTRHDMIRALATLNGKLLHDDYIVLHSPKMAAIQPWHQTASRLPSRLRSWSSYDRPTVLLKSRQRSAIPDSRFNSYRPTTEYKPRLSSNYSYADDLERKHGFTTHASSHGVREQRLKSKITWPSYKPRSSNSSSRTAKRRRSHSSEDRYPIERKCRSEITARPRPRHTNEDRKKRISRTRSKSPSNKRTLDLKKCNFSTHKSKKLLKQNSKKSSCSPNRKSTHLNYQVKNYSLSSSRILHYEGDESLNSTKKCRTKNYGNREEKNGKRKAHESDSKSKKKKGSHPSALSSSSSTRPTLPISPITPYDIPKTPTPTLSPRSTPEANYKQELGLREKMTKSSPSYTPSPEVTKKTRKLNKSSNSPRDFDIPKTPTPTRSTPKADDKQELREKMVRPIISYTPPPKLSKKTRKLTKSSNRPRGHLVKDDLKYYNNDPENNGKHYVLISEAGSRLNSTDLETFSSHKKEYDETSSKFSSNSSSSSTSSSDSSSTSESSESSSSGSEPESSCSKPVVLHLSIGENSLVHTSDSEEKDSAMEVGLSEIKQELVSRPK